MASTLQVRRLPPPLIDTLSSLLSKQRSVNRLFSTTRSKCATLGLDALNAYKGDRERVVILGSGWAGQS